jgi:hypothetical protein
VRTENVDLTLGNPRDAIKHMLECRVCGALAGCHFGQETTARGRHPVIRRGSAWLTSPSGPGLFDRRVAVLALDELGDKPSETEHPRRPGSSGVGARAEARSFWPSGTEHRPAARSRVRRWLERPRTLWPSETEHPRPLLPARSG